ncbi:MAG: 3-deoxy-8-phosphooctulonate synthase [Candidatus Latescibacteria bacterium]|nr:3-deoxy-8-phosphooctulonate synthase [Candidatus Latescibacterota bacterium]
MTSHHSLVKVGAILIGREAPLVLIAGPCVVESEELTLETAERIKQIAARLQIPFIFKSSYAKANRMSIGSFSGLGIDEGLRILSQVKTQLNLPVLTDVHSAREVEKVAAVADILQIPAFLCRQTELAIAVGKTGKPVNIKKGQFLAPEDMGPIAEKIRSTGNDQIILTERGTCFGYHNLVVDMRSLVIMRELGYPVVFDATHSVQLPGGGGSHSGGQPEFVPPLARAAVAVGVDGVFIETHPSPAKALSDASSMLPLQKLEPLLLELKKLDEICRCLGGSLER